MTLKAFAMASLRTATAFFFALLALVAVVAGYSLWQERTARQRAILYESVRAWDAGVREVLDFELKARTKLVEGRMLAAIEVEGLPRYILAPKNKDATLTLEFVDGDGFETYTRTVRMSDFTSIVDAVGERSGLAMQFEDYMDIEKYERFRRLRMRWNLDVNAAPFSPSKSQDAIRPALDHCAPDLQRAERLRRLAQHGAVREAGLGEYTAGTRSLRILPDGSLLNCR